MIFGKYFWVQYRKNWAFWFQPMLYTDPKNYNKQTGGGLTLKNRKCGPVQLVKVSLQEQLLEWLEEQNGNQYTSY